MPKNDLGVYVRRNQSNRPKKTMGKLPKWRKKKRGGKKLRVGKR